MKVIDLLNKIANGEEVPMIKYNDRTLKYNKKYDWFDDIKSETYCKEYFIFSSLNKEVEIIEEDKKIEKIQRLNQDNFQCVSNLEASGQSANYFEYGLEDEIRDIVDKINEIIEVLNETKH